jgi:hypothetical protein
MIIITKNDIKNNLYIAKIDTEVTSIEQALMDAYGEPQFDITGVIPFTNSLSQPDSFTISGGPQTKYVRSSMQLTFSISSLLDPEAPGKVRGWSVEMKNRITAAITDLKTKPLLDVPDIQYYEA